MSKVWNDEKVYEINIRFSKEAIQPNTEYQVGFIKTFDETIQIHFEENSDFSLSQNPLVLDSKSNTLGINFNIPGIYELATNNIDGPPGNYKFSKEKLFEIFRSGDKLTLINIKCRW